MSSNETGNYKSKSKNNGNNAGERAFTQSVVVTAFAYRLTSQSRLDTNP
jgi:hypothetical protein